MAAMRMWRAAAWAAVLVGGVVLFDWTGAVDAVGQTSRASDEMVLPQPGLAPEDGASANADASGGGGGMTLWEAAVLGVVEGLTEYLPVSSTGHLLVTQQILGITGEAELEPPLRSGVGGAAAEPDAEAMAAAERAKEAADAYAICIQAGAILAVLGLYAGRVRQGVRGLLGKDAEGLRLAMNILAGFMPAAVIGLLANDWIKEHLFGGGRWGLWPIIAAWFIGGVAILVVAWRRRVSGEPPTAGMPLEQLTWRLALIIGFAQCIAMWPGVSRSLITIVGGVLVGLSLPAAVEFSFLLGVVTLGAATVYDGLKHGTVMLEVYSPATLIVGMLAALISAAMAVKWMVSYLRNHGMQIFGYYRVAIAIAVAVAVLSGWLR